jgi:hypothetical protein
MLTRTPNAALASDGKAKQEPASSASPANAPINEPGADWVPIERALFWYGRSGYIQSANEWGEELGLVATFRKPSPWKVDGRYARLEHEGLALVIDRERVEFGLEHSSYGYYRWPDDLERASDFFSELPRTYMARGLVRISPDQKKVAELHREDAGTVFEHFRSTFLSSLSSGAAHIMARRNTVLAPFERVTWDQWQYFTLKDVDPSSQDGDFTHEPNRPRGPSTAVGPTGEKLYAIYIAPGVASSVADSGGGDNGPKMKCLHWLRKLRHDFPDRPPKPLRKLAEEARAAFPGLSKRAFNTALSLIEFQSGNANWSRPGAWTKSPRKSPHKN